MKKDVGKKGRSIFLRVSFGKVTPPSPPIITSLSIDSAILLKGQGFLHLVH
jgi:hypothetical protein